MSLSPSRKQKKELRKLQKSATELWEAQQLVAQNAAAVAREAGRQAGRWSRERVAPAVGAAVEPYVERARPYVEQGVKSSKRVIDSKVVPAVGTVVGRAMGAWDAANETRMKLAGRVVEPPKKKSAGPIIALVLGAAAVVGVLVAAWQTLRADDELWVADDPLSTPDA